MVDPSYPVIYCAVVFGHSVTSCVLANASFHCCSVLAVSFAINPAKVVGGIQPDKDVQPLNNELNVLALAVVRWLNNPSGIAVNDVQFSNAPLNTALAAVRVKLLNKSDGIAVSDVHPLNVLTNMPVPPDTRFSNISAGIVVSDVHPLKVLLNMLDAPVVMPANIPSGSVVNDVQFWKVPLNVLSPPVVMFSNIPSGTVVSDVHPLKVLLNMLSPPVRPANSPAGILPRFVQPLNVP